MKEEDIFFFVKVDAQKYGSHRITEQVSLEATTGAHLVQTPCSSRDILDHMAQDCVPTVLEYLQ